MFKELFASDKSKRWFGFITSIIAESNGKFLLGEKVSDNLYPTINRTSKYENQSFYFFFEPLSFRKILRSFQTTKSKNHLQKQNLDK